MLKLILRKKKLLFAELNERKEHCDDIALIFQKKSRKSLKQIRHGIAMKLKNGISTG